MPFPNVDHCLFCDDVRHEVGGALSLMGFYGVAPKATVRIQDLATALPRLCIVFLTAEVRAAETYDLKFQIIDEQRRSIFDERMNLKTRLALAPSIGKRGQMIVAFQQIKFREVGTHRVTLEVDGVPFYETCFEVKQISSSSPTG